MEVFGNDDVMKKVSEYDKKTPQSHIDHPHMTLWGRVTEHLQSQAIRKTLLK